jgi:hypothetical protein
MDVMGRGTLVLACVMLAVSVAGLVLLYAQYVSPIAQPASPAIVARSEARPLNQRPPRAIPPFAQLDPSRETSSDADDADTDIASTDANADALSAPEALPASAAPFIATAGDRQAESPIPEAPTASSAPQVVVIAGPPQPARPQLAPSPDAPATRIDEPGIAREIGRAVAATVSPLLVAGGPRQADDARAAGSSALAGPDNLIIAHTAEPMMTFIVNRTELSPRERLRVRDDGLRWRDVFTDHLSEPDRPGHASGR